MSNKHENAFQKYLCMAGVVLSVQQLKKLEEANSSRNWVLKVPQIWRIYKKWLSENGNELNKQLISLKEPDGLRRLANWILSDVNFVE